MYSLKEALSGILRTPLMTSLSVFSITVVMVIFVFFGILIFIGQGVVEKIQENAEINIYITDSLPNEDMLALDSTISSMKEVKSTRIISKAEAAVEFEKLFGKDLLSVSKENPLPRSIVVSMKDDFKMSTDIENVVLRLRGVSGIESVEYGKEWLSGMDTFLIIFLFISSIIIAFMTIACFLIIANTISLTILARKENIEIMRLVGATDSFISLPYFIEGIFQGFIAGLITFLIYFSLISWLESNYSLFRSYMLINLSDLNLFEYKYYALALIPLGSFLGLMGSYIGVKRIL